jgi:hypothetical protein
MEIDGKYHKYINKNIDNYLTVSKNVIMKILKNKYKFEYI